MYRMTHLYTNRIYTRDERHAMNLVSWIETFIHKGSNYSNETNEMSYAGIHHSKYWMPIHYDTIEDEQNRKSHLLFSNYVSKLVPTDIDECSTGAHQCSTADNKKCKNTAASHECVCQTGYYDNSGTCSGK